MKPALLSLTGIGIALLAAACSSSPSPNGTGGTGATGAVGSGAAPSSGGSGVTPSASGNGATSAGSPGTSSSSGGSAGTPPISGGGSAGTPPISGGGSAGTPPSSGGGTAGANSGSAGANTGAAGAVMSGGGAETGGTMNAGGMDNAGTAGTAGAGGSMTTPVARPSLVTSGEGAYWQVSEVTMGGASASITVNSGQTFQEWYGWGGTFNEAGWAALQALSEADRQRAINLLFDVNDGIGFDWGRIPIGPSDYAVARYTLSDAPGQFSIDHDLNYLVPYIKAAQAVKGDVKYWGSPWTPPPWAKSGNTENSGYDKGYFNTDYYQQYADFFVAWIQAYEAQGIPIDSVMPQNEPGWAQSYPTCAWGPATDSVNSAGNITGPVTLGTFVDSYLFPSLDAAGLGTNVWMGTLSNNSVFNDYWSDMASKPSFSRIVGGALQWETQASINTVLNAGKLVMQSEHKCGNYPWLGSQASSPADANRDNFLSTMAPNNHAYGEESWDLMKSWIEDGANIYSAWNMVLDTGGFNLDQVRPWPQNAMLAVDTNAGTLQVTPYYYVFRHLAQYVDAGAVRIGVTGGNALAFKNPDNSIITIMYNQGQSASATTLSIDGTMVQFDIPARGWATVSWQG